MKIGVTGATGRLGGGIIDELLRRGIEAQDIVPIIRNTDKAQGFIDRGMAPAIAAFEDYAALELAFTGLDKVVIVSPPEMNNGLRARQLHNTSFAAQASDIKHYVLVGLAAPEERPFGLEDVELSVEHLVRAIRLPFTFVRNGVYLDELKVELMVAAASGKLLSTTTDQRFNWLLRRDMAAAAAAVLAGGDHFSKTYELTMPEPFTYEDLAAALTEVAGRTVTHHSVEPDTAIAALTDGGTKPSKAASIVNWFQSAIAANKFTERNDGATVLLGHAPSLAESLGRLLDKPLRADNAD